MNLPVAIARTRGGVRAAMQARASALRNQAEAFASLGCPRCGGALASWSARTGAWKCTEGHMSVGAPAPSRAAGATTRRPRAATVTDGIAGMALCGTVTATGCREVADQLRAAERAGARCVLFVIDSPGGDALAALDLHAALRRLSARGTPVTTFVPGEASSAASIIALGGDHIVMAPGSSMLMHATSAAADTDLADADARFAKVYEGASPQASAEEVVALLCHAGDLRMAAGDVVRLGFADAVGGLEHARAVAAAYVRGEDVWSERRAALAARSR